VDGGIQDANIPEVSYREPDGARAREHELRAAAESVRQRAEDAATVQKMRSPIYAHMNHRSVGVLALASAAVAALAPIYLAQAYAYFWFPWSGTTKSTTVAETILVAAAAWAVLAMALGWGGDRLARRVTGKHSALSLVAVAMAALALLAAVPIAFGASWMHAFVF